MVKTKSDSLAGEGLEIESVGAGDGIAGSEESAGVIVGEVGEMGGAGTEEEGVGAADGVVVVDIVVVGTEAGVGRGEVDGQQSLVGTVEDTHTEALGLGEEIFGSGGAADNAVDGGVEFEVDDGVVVGDGDDAVEEGGVLVDGQLVKGVVGGVGEELFGELLDFEVEVVGGGAVGEELCFGEGEDDGVDDHGVESDVVGVRGQCNLGVERGGGTAEGSVVVVADDTERGPAGLEGVVEFGPSVVGIEGVDGALIEGGGVDEVDAEVRLLVGARSEGQGSKEKKQ